MKIRQSQQEIDHNYFKDHNFVAVGDGDALSSDLQQAKA